MTYGHQGSRTQERNARWWSSSQTLRASIMSNGLTFHLHSEAGVPDQIARTNCAVQRLP